MPANITRATPAPPPRTIVVVRPIPARDFGAPIPSPAEVSGSARNCGTTVLRPGGSTANSANPLGRTRTSAATGLRGEGKAHHAHSVPAVMRPSSPRERRTLRGRTMRHPRRRSRVLSLDGRPVYPAAGRSMNPVPAERVPIRFPAHGDRAMIRSQREPGRAPAPEVPLPDGDRVKDRSGMRRHGSETGRTRTVPDGDSGMDCRRRGLVRTLCRTNPGVVLGEGHGGQGRMGRGRLRREPRRRPRICVCGC